MMFTFTVVHRENAELKLALSSEHIRTQRVLVICSKIFFVGFFDNPLFIKKKENESDLSGSSFCCVLSAKRAKSYTSLMNIQDKMS